VPKTLPEIVSPTASSRLNANVPPVIAVDPLNDANGIPRTDDDWSDMSASIEYSSMPTSRTSRSGIVTRPVPVPVNDAAKRSS
jgi:hypothetical protein